MSCRSSSLDPLSFRSTWRKTLAQPEIWHGAAFNPVIGQMKGYASNTTAEPHAAEFLGVSDLAVAVDEKTGSHEFGDETIQLLGTKRFAKQGIDRAS